MYKTNKIQELLQSRLYCKSVVSDAKYTFLDSDNKNEMFSTINTEKSDLNNDSNSSIIQS